MLLNGAIRALERYPARALLFGNTPQLVSKTTVRVLIKDKDSL